MVVVDDDDLSIVGNLEVVGGFWLKGYGYHVLNLCVSCHTHMLTWLTACQLCFHT